jgi:NifU-like protein involved in Fe-S cluster formation
VNFGPARQVIDPLNQTPATDRTDFYFAETWKLPRPARARRPEVAPRAGPAYIASMPAALYTRDILRLASAIPHLGRLAARQASVEQRSPVCGSRVAVDVELDGEGRVAALGQEVKACALGQASAALMGAHALGRTAAELEAARDTLAAWLAGTREDPGGWPGLEALAPARAYPARHAAILLAFSAAAEAAALAARADAA